MRKLNEKYLPKDEGQKTWLLWQHTVDLMGSYINTRLEVENKISYEQFLVLLLIRSIGKEANATFISRQLGRNPNTLSTILDRMEKAGLVKKTRDTTDRRIVYATMTDKGKKILKAADVTGARLIEKFTGIFTPEERQTIRAFTSKLDKAITDDLAERTAKVKKQRRVDLS